MLWLSDGWLHLGGLESPGANEFRSGEKVVVDGGHWTDFAATVQLRLLDRGEQAGMLFRVQQPAVGYNAQRGYYAGVGLASSRAVLGFMDGKTWHELASATLPESMPDTVVLGVEASGDHLMFRLQDKVVIDAYDTTFSTGSVGLRVVDSHAAFSGLHIKPLVLSSARGKKSPSTMPVYVESLPGSSPTK
jgi:hypothetical protein